MDCTKERVITSDWIVSADDVAIRLVLLRWKDKEGKVFQYSVHKERSDPSKEGWTNPEKPDYLGGDYFAGQTELTQHMLTVYGERKHDFFYRRADGLKLNEDGSISVLIFG